ncbi:MAG: cadherin domain-containing protein, partial [Pirellula sp.]
VVGLTAFASDADATNNSVTYALSNSAGGRFAINSTTGQVSVAASTLLDFEASSSHGIVIVATSGDGSTSVGSFIIQVANVNEASVSAISDTSAAINEVAENSSAGATVGITAFATDSDGTDSVLYSLMDNAGGLFAIDSTTGVVTTTASLDRELSASYSILVTATSSDGSSSSHRFTIDIQDVDEVAPTLSSSAVITMPENVQFAGLLTATDADSSSVVTFSIIGGADQGLLEIVRGNELAFRIAPNFETPVDQNVDNQYEIMVRVSDSAGNYTDEAISIGVVNVNEAPIDSTLSLVAIEDTPLEVPISGILTGIVDPDGDALTVTIAMGATHGTVTLRTDGTLVYSASALFHGADSFVLEVNDGSGGIAQIFATVAVDAGFSGIQIIADADNSTSTTDTTDSSNSTDSVSESTSSQTSTSSDTASSDTKSQDSSTLQLTSNVQAPTTESGATSPNESETNGNSSLVATETARSNNARSDRSSASSAVLESIFEYRSVREFARQGSLRMEEQASFVTAQIYDLVQTQAVLWQDLDQIRENIVNGTNDSLPIPLGAATGVASSLSVGYVIWLLRSGYIVAGVMAQLPAWGLIDPLPILSQLDDLDDDDDDSLAALVDKSNAQEDAAIESRRLISTVEEFAE